MKMREDEIPQSCLDWEILREVFLNETAALQIDALTVNRLTWFET